jgi:hypothetical protein
MMMRIPWKALLAKAWVWLEPRLRDEIAKEAEKKLGESDKSPPPVMRFPP